MEKLASLLQGPHGTVKNKLLELCTDPLSQRTIL
jgi:hypothetical protein